MKEDPLQLNAWANLAKNAELERSVIPTAEVAAMWFPGNVDLAKNTRSVRGEDLLNRIRDLRFAYSIDTSLHFASLLGRALAEAGREDDAWGITAAPDEDDESRAWLQAYVLGFIDLHKGQIARGLGHLEGAGMIGMTDLVVVATVAGRATEVATNWAT